MFQTLRECTKSIEEAREGASASTDDLAEDQRTAPACVVAEYSDQEDENIMADTEIDVLEEDEEEDEDEMEDDLHEQDQMEEEYLSAIPTDWSPPDSPENPDYKIGFSHIAESIAGKLGGKLPMLIDQQNRPRQQVIPNWIPKSMKKKCAPASSYLSNLLRKCDKIFREVNKNSLDKKKGILAR